MAMSGVRMDDIIRLLDVGAVSTELPRYALLLRGEAKRRRLAGLLECASDKLNEPTNPAITCRIASSRLTSSCFKEYVKAR
jgi:hypothetical protein